MFRSSTRLAAALLALCATCGVAAATPVTVDTYVRAESDLTMQRYVRQGAFGRLVHLREPTPIDRQDVIRMNRDTLYSFAVLDLGSPATIVKPDGKGRFMSLMTVSQDHSIRPAIHEAGRFTLTRESIGTRYVLVLIRTFVDANDPDDVRAAQALQDRIQLVQARPGTFGVPDWDEEKARTLREAINVLAATRPDASAMFGEKSRLKPLDHLMGAAYGWGGNPREAAIYVNRVPKLNDGTVPHVLKVRNVPVDGFWSVTVYDDKGFMRRNDLGAYSLNERSARRDPDGGWTIRFGGDPKAPNMLPITPGWNYIVRLYRPRKALLDGSWTFPVEVPAAP
jgi:hypothetical protein